VQELDYEVNSRYQEYADEFEVNGVIYDPCSYELRNSLRTTGSGINVKVGAIIKPLSALRFGFSIHTPTYYSLTDAYGSAMTSEGIVANGLDAFEVHIDEDASSYELITPGKLVYSAAWQFGKKGLLSMDWEVMDYSKTKLKDMDGMPYDDTNMAISRHMRTAHTIRIGGEYRLSDQLALRAGYAVYQSAYKEKLASTNPVIYTAGTTPYYSFDTGSHAKTLGVGYRSSGFFMDAALLYQNMANSSSVLRQ
jgi:long-subunit fatty acid transport protein